jgi:hypothetical protein
MLCWVIEGEVKYKKLLNKKSHRLKQKEEANNRVEQNQKSHLVNKNL